MSDKIQNYNFIFMLSGNNKQSKTPLAYFEIAIEELIKSRQEIEEIKSAYLENFNSSLQFLQAEIKELKDELRLTQAKLEDYNNKTEKIYIFLDKLQAIEESNKNNLIKEIRQIKQDILQGISQSQQDDFQKSVLETLPEILFQLSQLTENHSINYKKLEQLLVDNKWQEADEETYSLILKICHHKKGRWLVDEELLELSNHKLEKINKLWIKYSEDRFGFSIQKKIFQASNDCQHFAYQVGWLENLSNPKWIKHDKYIFSLDAPQGHLPSITRLVGLGYRDVSEKSYRINRINIFLTNY